MWTFLLLAITLASAREFSVSGYSGGAFMAAQVHFAFSKDVITSGIVSGGPYYCSGGSYEGTIICMNRPEEISLYNIYEFIQTQEEAGTIDSTSYLKAGSAFIFTGAQDSVVIPGVGKLGFEVYKKFMDIERIIAEFSVNAEHTWPTDGLGDDCLDIGIGDCQYDAAQKIFNLAYGNLNPKTDMIRDNMKYFYQENYTSDLASSGLAERGFVYIPSSCQQDSSECRVHISLHGCGMGYDGFGEYFIIYTGLNEWAENNDIIVIYPQISAEEPFSSDYEGCWDYWGYTREDFPLKSGIQMDAIYKMTQNPPAGEGSIDDQDEDSDDNASCLTYMLALGILLSF